MQILYVSLAGVLMFCWVVLAFRGPRKVETPNVLGVLRYGAGIRMLALGLALLQPLIVVYVVWVFPWRTERALHLAGVSFLTFGVIAGLLLIESTRVQVVVTDEGLTRYSPWTGPLTLKWIEVERVGYSSVNRWFIVEGAGRTIRASRHLADIRVFADAVRRHVAAERCTLAATVLQACV
ncbi:MAG: hypothetical protein HY289_03775 [Planctomycetes bacterium]|nr:hypothetical protein [Planctomycetota bacterium]